MGKLKLTVNEEKTRICKMPEGEFDFLGYTFGRMFSARTGQARLGYRPSKKSIQRVVEKVHATAIRRHPRLRQRDSPSLEKRGEGERSAFRNFRFAERDFRSFPENLRATFEGCAAITHHAQSQCFLT